MLLRVESGLPYVKSNGGAVGKLIRGVIGGVAAAAPAIVGYGVIVPAAPPAADGNTGIEEYCGCVGGVAEYCGYGNAGIGGGG